MFGAAAGDDLNAAGLDGRTVRRAAREHVERDALADGETGQRVAGTHSQNGAGQERHTGRGGTASEFGEAAGRDYGAAAGPDRGIDLGAAGGDDELAAAADGRAAVEAGRGHGRVAALENGLVEVGAAGENRGDQAAQDYAVAVLRCALLTMRNVRLSSANEQICVMRAVVLEHGGG